MALAEDASAPPVKTQSGTTSPITTAAFSPPANSLVLALVATGWSTMNFTTAITLTDSGAHTWTNVNTQASLHDAGSNAGGTSAVYECYFASAPGSITLSAAFTNLAGGSALCTKVITGANSSQVGAATAKAEFGHATNVTTGSTSITTTTAGSLVYGMCTDGQKGSALTVNGSTTLISAYNDTTDIVMLDFIKSSSVTGTPGAVTLGGTWASTTQSNIVLAEVLPAGGGPPPPPMGGFFPFLR